MCSKEESRDQPVEKEIIQKENLAQRHIGNVSDQEEEEKVPDIQRDDLAKRKTHGSVAQQKESLVFGNSSITKADLATWQRLKLSSKERCGFSVLISPQLFSRSLSSKFYFLAGLI